MARTQLDRRPYWERPAPPIPQQVKPEPTVNISRWPREKKLRLVEWLKLHNPALYEWIQSDFTQAIREKFDGEILLNKSDLEGFK